MGTALLDAHLNIADVLMDSFPVLANLPGCALHILHAAARAVGADLVIVDTNPNMGGLNQYLWWSSDYFLVPCASDCFSLFALDFLHKRFYDWAKTIRTNLSKTSQSRRQQPLSKSEPPRCLGLTLSHINPSSDLSWKQRLLDAATAKLTPLESAAFLHEFQHKAGLVGGPLWQRIAALLSRKRPREEDEEEEKEAPVAKKAKSAEPVSVIQ